MTYTASTSWVQHGTDIPVTFVNGDQFGARAKADGDVQVYQNGNLLAVRSVTAWSYYSAGGYIGVGFANVTGVLIDNFGGGNVSSGATPTPTLTLTPSPTGFDTPSPTAAQPTPTGEASPTPTATQTATSTPTATASPSPTPTIPPFTGATFVYDGDGKQVI